MWKKSHIVVSLSWLNEMLYAINCKHRQGRKREGREKERWKRKRRKRKRKRKKEGDNQKRYEIEKCRVTNNSYDDDTHIQFSFVYLFLLSFFFHSSSSFSSLSSFLTLRNNFLLMSVTFEEFFLSTLCQRICMGDFCEQRERKIQRKERKKRERNDDDSGCFWTRVRENIFKIVVQKSQTVREKEREKEKESERNLDED